MIISLLFVKKAIKISEDDQQDIEIIIYIYKFLQLLCEGHNL